jgi:2-phosphosulfolactate phosphatase
VTGLDVILLPEELQRKEITNCLVVVIDVLRVSSTITTALAAGASKIIPVYLPEEARQREETFRPGEVLLCNERKGKKLSGFNLGNSPREYNNKKVKGKIVIITTTNVIRTIELVRRANRIIIGCFLNIQVIVKYCRSYSGEVLLVCAGDQGTISLEDTVCAGMIMALCECQSQKYDIHYNDSLIAYRLYQEFSHDLFAMMQTSIWGQHLIKMGLTQDLVYCAQENIYHYVPVVKDDLIVSNNHCGDSEPLK